MKLRIAFVLFLLVGVIFSAGWGSSSKQMAREHCFHASRIGYWCGVNTPWISTETLDQQRLDELTCAVKLDPDNADYHYLLAEFYKVNNPFDAEIQYRIAGRLDPYYQAAWLYIQANDSFKAISPETEQLLKQAQKLDPKNGLLDYELANYYAHLNQLQKAFEFVRSGNRKPECRIYLPRLYSDPEFKFFYLTDRIWRYDFFTRSRATCLRLCLIKNATYNLLTKKHDPQQLNTSKPYFSLVQRTLQSGDQLKAVDICEEMIEMGKRTACIGPNTSLFTLMSGLNNYDFALRSEANLYDQAGDLKHLGRVQARFDAIHRRTTRISNQYFWKTKAFENSLYYKILYAADSKIGNMAPQSPSFDYQTLMSHITYKLIWFGVPVLVILPFLISVILLTLSLLRKKSGSSSRARKLIQLGLILLFLFGLSKVSVILSNGWNPLIDWADRRSLASYYSYESTYTKKLTDAIQHL
jgi:peptide methionine sulfoxide reductase MsrA